MYTRYISIAQWHSRLIRNVSSIPNTGQANNARHKYSEFCYLTHAAQIPKYL